MSALAGLWNFDGKPDAAEQCRRMLQAQAIYGPHGSDIWDGEFAALGRNLYRTLPEDIHDAQPLVGGGGRFVMIADVRLDNRDELTATLAIAPEQARTSSDAAFVLAAWERWQEQCFARLMGDFAIAVLDRSRRCLVLARDASGMRPLNFHRAANFVAFASMPKGLHALPAIPRMPDEEKVAEHLALLPETGSRSFYRNVERILPGSFATVTPDGCESHRHWEPARRRLNLPRAQDYADALLERLDEAVQSRLRGGGNAVGAHLSSGMDSSAVATSAALSMAGKGGRVVAFTSVPREGYRGRAPHGRHGDEGPVAAKTAAMYPNIEHVRVPTAGRSPFAGMDRAFYLYDQPMLHLCNNVWYDAINDEAKRRGLGIMLIGAMGNMTLSYDGLPLLADLVKRGRLLGWTRQAAGILRRRSLRWTGLMAFSFASFVPSALWQRIAVLSGRAQKDITHYSAIRSERVRELDIDARAEERGLDLTYRPRTDGFEARLWALRRVDFGNVQKGILAGWGIDQRDPTTDRRLIEFCLSVPDEEYLKDGETRALARLALAGRVPAEVTHPTSRGYQTIDWHEGLAAARGELSEELDRLDECPEADRAIDLQRLRRLANDMPQEANWASQRTTSQYRYALLRAVSVGHFLRRASGSNR